MKEFYNKELVDKARTQLLLNHYNGVKKSQSLMQEFDKNGNVIRNHQKELEVLVEDERQTIIPEADISAFDSFRLLKRHREKNTGFQPIVKRVKLAEIPVFPKREIFNFKNMIAQLYSFLF